MTLVYASVSKTNLNCRTHITTYHGSEATYFAIVSQTDGFTVGDGPPDRLLSLPASDLFHGVERSVTKNCESMLLLFRLDLVHRVICA